MIYGIDLLRWMVELANGHPPAALYQKLEGEGAAIEVRICSEEPLRDFRPSSGILQEVSFPKNVRVDTWISTRQEIFPYYDSLLAKVIVHASDRQGAVEQMRSALAKTRLSGISTNLNFLRALFSSSDLMEGNLSVQFLTNGFSYQANAIEVLEAGTYTTVQDYPGRIGYWDVGVPPSGPMDDYAFRLANRLVGNKENAAGLECTLIGPILRFHTSTTVALTGGRSNAKLNGQPIPSWKAIPVHPGEILDIGRAIVGCRIYLSVRGGFDLPLYLNSRSTFVLGQFGGYAGRILHPADVLYLDKCVKNEIAEEISKDLIPDYPDEGEEWRVGVLYGPHGAPDFFTEEFIEQFLSVTWKAQYNLNRLGVRLSGIKPSWSRRDGGEAGLHPSNIHDCEYAIGSINFTGDTPIILTQDGPSLGGFVCPFTVAKAELWKIGQVKPNDRIRFIPITFDQALKLEVEQDKSISSLIPLNYSLQSSEIGQCILYELVDRDGRPKVLYRQAGDHYILIEYGPMHLDLRLRFRVHYLIEELRHVHPVQGIIELSPGVRSLQVHYDSRVINQKELLQALLSAEEHLPIDENEFHLPSRIVYLPLAFEDSATLDVVQRYRETVRESAPWLPNNVDFIQRINGLQSRDEVRKIVFDASYLILGLGDVYLGAPCAVPIDPRHRLVTSKYNPARTYTAEGTVGIGGVYMCIYGMDSPGGYQLIGRTLPIWNTFNRNEAFKDGNPWLLRFFDQVKFYPVDEHELAVQRQAFRQGNFHIRMVEDNIFHLAEYNQFLQREAPSIEQFTTKQALAFAEEVSHWQKDNEQNEQLSDQQSEIKYQEEEIHGQNYVSADICGSVWKILVEVNETVEENTPLVLLEAMKMEIVIRSPVSGKISSIRCRLGQLVLLKDVLLTIQSD